MNDIERARAKRDLLAANPLTAKGGAVIHDALVKLPRAERMELIHDMWRRGCFGDSIQAALMTGYGYEDAK